MINQAILEKIILDQDSLFQKKDPGITRDLDFAKYLDTSQITVISGIRRSGKSTLLRQFSKHYKNFYYLNFDDERLVDFAVSDFQNLMILFQKQFESKIIFLDEIQNVPQWERFVRRIFEEGYKIFLTGSNANLLSSELATHLTGRYLKLELYPFSFKELLTWDAVDFTGITSKKEANILKKFDQYLEKGGFPEFIKSNNSESLKQIFEDIVYKDILTRFRIREIKNFKQLINYLMTNISCQVSYNSLKNFLGFKSATSVKNYIEFTQESYLIFELPKYDYSLKKQYVSNKKIYAIDNGMRNAVAFSFSEDGGKMLENLVFIELKRRGQEVYYYKDGNECDFILKEKNKITQAIQVTKRLEGENEKRELGGLLDALKMFDLKVGLIITESQEEEREVEGKLVRIIPAWKWLLNKKKKC